MIQSNILDILVNDLEKSITIDNIKLTLERKGFINEKEETKFIKSIEGLVRRSLEYYEFVSYIRDTLGNKYCAFTLETNEETNDIELHHHPFCLYDIVETVCYNKIKNNETFTSLSIAEEVLDLHYKMYVGIVPLLGSLHKKYHNGFLDIPIEFVVGNYMKIFEIYSVPKHISEKVMHLINITKDTINHDNTWYIGLTRVKNVK